MQNRRRAGESYHEPSHHRDPLYSGVYLSRSYPHLMTASDPRPVTADDLALSTVGRGHAQATVREYLDNRGPAEGPVLDPESVASVLRRLRELDAELVEMARASRARWEASPDFERHRARLEAGDLGYPNYYHTPEAFAVFSQEIARCEAFIGVPAEPSLG